MSFLIDPPLLYGGGRAYERATRDSEPSRSRDAAAGAAFMAIFWGVSIGLYLDWGWTRPVWRMCGAASGRDWMLNSGLFRLEWRWPSARTHAIAGAIFATYPLWLWLGMRHVGRCVGMPGPAQTAAQGEHEQKACPGRRTGHPPPR